MAWHGMAGGAAGWGAGSRGERRKTSGWNTKGDAVRWGWSDFRRGVAAHTSGTAREGLFLSAKKAENESMMNSHVVVDRTRGHPLESFGAQARPPCLAWPRFYNQKQHFRRFLRGGCGRSLARDRVNWVHEGLEYIPHETHNHQNRSQRSPGAPQGVICALRP